MRDRPKVGQTVYSLNVGNAARRRKQTLTPMEVMKVGRKYFTAAEESYKDSPHMHVKFHIENWAEKTEYTSDHCLYESAQEFEDDIEKERLGSKIREAIGNYGRINLTLEQLRDIDGIIGDS